MEAREIYEGRSLELTFFPPPLTGVGRNVVLMDCSLTSAGRRRRHIERRLRHVPRAKIVPRPALGKEHEQESGMVGQRQKNMPSGQAAASASRLTRAEVCGRRGVGPARWARGPAAGPHCGLFAASLVSPACRSSEKCCNTGRLTFGGILHSSYIRLTSVLRPSYMRLTCVLDYVRRGVLDHLRRGVLDNLRRGVLDNLRRGVLDNLRRGVLDYLRRGVLDQ